MIPGPDRAVWPPDANPLPLAPNSRAADPATAYRGVNLRSSIRAAALAKGVARDEHQGQEDQQIQDARQLGAKPLRE